MPGSEIGREDGDYVEYVGSVYAGEGLVEPGEDSVYVVEDLVDKRQVNGVVQYRVRWDGYGESDDTWEPIENLTASCLPCFRRLFGFTAALVALFIASLGGFSQLIVEIGGQHGPSTHSLTNGQRESVQPGERDLVANCALNIWTFTRNCYYSTSSEEPIELTLARGSSPPMAVNFLVQERSKEGSFCQRFEAAFEAAFTAPNRSKEEEQLRPLYRVEGSFLVRSFHLLGEQCRSLRPVHLITRAGTLHEVTKSAKAGVVFPETSRPTHGVNSVEEPSCRSHGTAPTALVTASNWPVRKDFACSGPHEFNTTLMDYAEMEEYIVWECQEWVQTASLNPVLLDENTQLVIGEYTDNSTQRSFALGDQNNFPTTDESAPIKLAVKLIEPALHADTAGKLFISNSQNAIVEMPYGYEMFTCPLREDEFPADTERKCFFRTFGTCGNTKLNNFFGDTPSCSDTHLHTRNTDHNSTNNSTQFDCKLLDELDALLMGSSEVGSLTSPSGPTNDSYNSDSGSASDSHSRDDERVVVEVAVEGLVINRGAELTRGELLYEAAVEHVDNMVAALGAVYLVRVIVACFRGH